MYSVRVEYQQHGNPHVFGWIAASRDDMQQTVNHGAVYEADGLESYDDNDDLSEDIWE